MELLQFSIVTKLHYFNFICLKIDLKHLINVLLFLQSTYPVLSTFAIIFVMVFVIAFAIGPGSIPWFMVSELFNSSSRPIATSIAVGVNWTANFLVGLGFLPLEVNRLLYLFRHYYYLIILYTFQSTLVEHKHLYYIIFLETYS